MNEFDHREDTSFDPGQVFDLETQRLLIQHGITIERPEDGAHHWSDFLPLIRIPLDVEGGR